MCVAGAVERDRGAAAGDLPHRLERLGTGDVAVGDQAQPLRGLDALGLGVDAMVILAPRPRASIRAARPTGPRPTTITVSLPDTSPRRMPS